MDGLMVVCNIKWMSRMELLYICVANLAMIKKEDFRYRKIKDIKVYDAQQWIMKLYNDGKEYSTITSVCGVVKPAFQMAYNEDIIRRNPFCGLTKSDLDFEGRKIRVDHQLVRERGGKYYVDLS